MAKREPLGVNVLQAVIKKLTVELAAAKAEIETTKSNMIAIDNRVKELERE